MSTVVVDDIDPGRGAERSLDDGATYAKVTWRLIPFLFACYVAAYLDRVNVGFAKLQMLKDLGFSETVYASCSAAPRPACSPA